jgi:hypothetical protein
LKYESPQDAVEAQKKLDKLIWPEKNNMQIRVSLIKNSDIKSLQGIMSTDCGFHTFVVHPKGRVDRELGERKSENSEKNHGKLDHILKNYFPPTRDSSLIAYDDDGLTYLTAHWLADEITEWIMGILFLVTKVTGKGIYRKKIGTAPEMLIDGTAGLGGHVLSFGLKTKVPSIVGVELDTHRYEVTLSRALPLICSVL